ncbi:GTP pyrophosphokinase [Yersinia ruckeri]|uniref:RelA/SpoT n=2 Tax=Yersinia ruckeri TaxID=29486 RepID=A0A0A8VD86_YERRU|nr:RelA/SpoT domain-containing protein [Yersinia ruckeri]MCK8594819.1 RelA/SpoT domain-containing protein [Yersinia ruckeri]MCK8597827.1 RelA/SpoT domain-containing protein [Yersinia ruckeri]MCW6610432.1 RelA/SpoT domain-containing protein [Yersinia ruckeri]MCW6618835.1 RelA/SpoT domain-containing protein [Yersinia ruckeri]MCW6622529.1 RelA/SpoT domain-containing protein [Yersinia ruckeri]
MDTSDYQGQNSDAGMTEAEFQAKWLQEESVYKSWGQFIVQEITSSIKERGKDLDTFLKLPAKHRLKDEKSLIDKAFYRAGKHYADPYNEIEDKVGARFVVLVIEDIELICDIIKSSEFWSFDACKHFNIDKENAPLLFTYQSVHFVLRPKHAITFNSVDIPIDIPCEVQIRTLLQHAHAELTHDAIYKAKTAIKPKVHRTVAKCMALIETTDDFFTQVSQELNQGAIEELGIISKLDALYYSFTGIKAETQKSILTILDEFEDLIDSELIGKIEIFVRKNKVIPEIIKSKYTDGALYKQSTILLIYWMLKYKKNKLLDNWPLDRKMLIPLANDLGVSTLDY